MIAESCTACAIAALIAIVYFVCFWKINLIHDIRIEASKSSKQQAKYKARVIGQLPPVYPNGWFGLLDSSFLKKGQVKYVAALGHNFAVYRTESGKVRILDAYCPHLGANLGDGGQVVGEELECPFHSWRFCGETGKCTGIPYTKYVPAGINMKVYENTEVNGVIFVWHHAESSPPNWWPEPIEEITTGTWRNQGRNEFYVNCHIQEISENGADFAHFKTVHSPAVIAKDFLSKILYHSWTNASWKTKSSIYSENSEDTIQQDTNKSHEALCSLSHSLFLFNKWSVRAMQMDVIGKQIGPGYVELHLHTYFGHMCVIQTVTPLEPLLQKVTHQMFASPLVAWFAKIILICETVMFARDVQIWNMKKFLNNPQLVSEEKFIRSYRRWYKQFYSEKSPTYKSCKNSTEW